jgi:hypothetical protein
MLDLISWNKLLVEIKTTIEKGVITKKKMYPINKLK